MFIFQIRAKSVPFLQFVQHQSLHHHHSSLGNFWWFEAQKSTPGFQYRIIMLRSAASATSKWFCWFLMNSNSFRLRFCNLPFSFFLLDPTKILYVILAQVDGCSSRQFAADPSIFIFHLPFHCHSYKMWMYSVHLICSTSIKNCPFLSFVHLARNMEFFEAAHIKAPLFLLRQ
jgi:hypothetical protein